MYYEVVFPVICNSGKKVETAGVEYISESKCKIERIGDIHNPVIELDNNYKVRASMFDIGKIKAKAKDSKDVKLRLYGHNLGELVFMFS